MRTPGRGFLAAIAPVLVAAVALAGCGSPSPRAAGTPGVQVRALTTGTTATVTSTPEPAPPVTVPPLPGPSGQLGAASATSPSDPPDETISAASTAPTTSPRATTSRSSHTSSRSTTAHTRSDTSRSRPTTASSTPSPSTPHSTSRAAAEPPSTSAAPTSHAAATTDPPTTSRPVPTTSKPPTHRPSTTSAPSTTSHPPRTTTTTAPTSSKRTSPKPPPAPDFGIPVTVGNARQVITVTASSSWATTGTLRAWQKRSDGRWVLAHGPYPAWLGSAGIGHQSEGSTRTPLGTFTLTQAFGKMADPGTALPYHRTRPNDWWVSDVHSRLYNTLQNCPPSNCPFNTSVSEHLYYITPYYDYAVVMDVNRWPAIPGDGSAFFLHITDHRPTAGCVAIERGPLLTVMRWLKPAQHPRIATGID